MLKPVLAAAAGLSLAGCMSMSRSAAEAPISADWRSNARVDQIVLNRQAGLKVTEGFDEIFKSRVATKLSGCARGERALRLEATLTRFDKANPVMTAVLGGANVLRGTARLVDVATGRTVGRYAIGQTIVGSRVAVIKMGEAEEQMSDAFGDELCKQAFAPPA